MRKPHFIAFWMLILIQLFQLKAHTQETNIYKEAFEFGIINSLNFTSLTGGDNSIVYGNRIENFITVGPRTTFDLGLYGDIYLSRKFVLGIDMVYSFTGAYVKKETIILNEIDTESGNENSIYAFNYFKAPVMLNFYPVDRFYIGVGGYAALLISGKEYTYLFDYFDRLPLDGASSFDAGMVAGMGFNTRIVRVGFQYSYGITPAYETNDLSMHNSMLQIITRWKLYSDIRKRQ